MAKYPEDVASARGIGGAMSDRVRGTGDMINAFYAPFRKTAAVVQMVLSQK
jgi:hypothetical protein